MQVARMQAGLAATLAEPTIRRRLSEAQGVDIVASSPAEFALFLAAQTARWTALIRARGIRAE
jgi:tripartite-type tricarboxylate transporter receptor subunit TctC